MSSLKFFLLLAPLLLAFAAPVNAKKIPGFWSIDCGGRGFEGYNNITYVSDEGFVRTGVTREGNNGSLRVFTTQKKNNCYTIPVGKGVKILVRLTFYYGNYDGLGSPPEMELIFDGYDWGKFQTSMEGGEWMEVIYVTKRKSTNICFGRTVSGQDPFAYTIDVRSLDPSVYRVLEETKILSLWTRNAFGASKMIRYPDDPYDRLWLPRSEGFTVLRSDTNYTNTTSWRTDDDPPPMLIRAAVGPLDITSSKLSIGLSDLPKDPVSIYHNIYFSEMSNMTTYGSRAFDLFIDGIQRTSEPIVPSYQSVDEYYNYGIEANNETTFEFVSTQDATLPPIISGIEVFTISSAANNLTCENDLVALGILQKRFKYLQEWTGDPCLPENYNWEWIGCRLYTIPRVTQLNLSGYGLSGKLPDFRHLDQLVTIDLHNNSLSGVVPEFLNNFKYLTTLNLANNKFTGIPRSLLNNKKIKLNISGNPIRLPRPRLR